MAERSWNPFRRNDAPHEGLVAAAQQIDLNNETAIQSALRRSEHWQEKVYDAYDACGEIWSAVNNLADLMSRITLFVAEVPEEKDSEPTRTTNSAVNAEMNRLGAPIEVGDNICSPFTRQMLLPAECFLVGIQPGDTPKGQAARPEREQWLVLAKQEFESNGQKGIRILDYRDGLPLELGNIPGDTWIRLWRPHPRKRQLADSPLRPLLDDIDELLWWSAAARARAKSRLTDTGILALPSSLDLPAQTDEERKLSGSARVIKRLMETVIKTLQNPGAASAVAPIMLTYQPNEQGKSGIEHIKMERGNDELIEARTDRCLRRVAQGFPLPVESFFGLSSANDWTGGTIEDQKFRENVEPFVLFMCKAITEAWLHPILRKRNIDPRRFVIWYDASNLIVFPDMAQAADKGVELDIISDKAWIRTRGFSEADLVSPEESAKRIERLRAMRGQDNHQEVSPRPADDPSNPNKDNTQPNNPSEHPPKDMPPPDQRGKGQQIMRSSINGHSNGHTNGHPDVGQRLAEIDNDLMLRLRVMADASMRRALEKAGNKLKSRANRNPHLKKTVHRVNAMDVAPTLGRDASTSLATTEELFSDAFEDVPTLFASWCDKAVDAALDAAAIPLDSKREPRFQLAYSTDQAASHLVRELKTLAASLLFTRPEPTDTPESDDLLVPASLIRTALSRAGGSPKPNLLLATGHAVNKILVGAGYFAHTHRWWYPISPRTPYLAHKQLDGQTFDIVGHLHQPSDVDDCQCLAVPVFN